MLSDAAIEVLKQYKARMASDQRPAQLVLNVSIEEAREIAEQERQLDGMQYAEWAAGRLVEVLRGSDVNPLQHLQEAELWAKKKLRRGYLVQPKWISHAFSKALQIARKPRNSHDSEVEHF